MALIHLEGVLSAFATSQVRFLASEDMVCLRNVFTRLEVQALVFIGTRNPSVGKPPAEREVPPAACMQGFPVDQGIKYLRDALTTLEYRSLQFLRSEKISNAKYVDRCRTSTSEPEVQAVRERDKLLRGLGMWLASYQAMSPQSNGASISRAHATLKRQHNLLYMRYLVVFILLNTCFDTDESAFDRYLLQFRQLISHARSLYPSWRTCPYRTFTLEMGLIQPLYFTALKCRQPEDRRCALELMRKCNAEGRLG